MRDDGEGGSGAKSPRGIFLNILISGAEGFTGRHLMARAVASGHAAHALQADLLDPEALQHEVAQTRPDMVIHLAAVSFVGHADTDAFYRVNVLGSLNLLDALATLEARPRRILVASSANVYGNCTQSPISEAQCPAPVNHYAASKLAMEHLARARLNDLPVFFTRPFNYTGVGQSSSFLIPKLVQHYAAGSESVELGNLEVEREFNDVRFVCDTYLRLLEQATPGETYNVCTGRTYTLHQVMDLLAELTGHHLQARTNPTFVRANEIQRLCGDPCKLTGCIGEAQDFPLPETLKWMLQEENRRLEAHPD